MIDVLKHNALIISGHFFEMDLQSGCTIVSEKQSGSVPRVFPEQTV
jgi:hypothetical protein